MFKKLTGKGLLAGVIVGSLMFSGIAYAASSITLLVNGKKINSEVEPEIINGSTVVPARALAEALGAKVTWDGANSTVLIESADAADSGNQIKQLEAALAPSTPNDAVNRYAEGVKTRNGALQFAVMSEELRNKFRESYESSHWVTGSSSPWVDDYKIEGSQVSDTEWKYTINYVYTSSTKERIPASETVFVKKYGDHWYISDNGPSLTIPYNNKAAKLTNQTAGLLVKGALQAYWHVRNGGQQADGAIITPVMINGKEYRYLGEDINTMDKLKSYLKGLFTEKVAQSIIEVCGIVEKDGELAQPNADGGSLLNFTNLSEEVSSSDTEAQFEFKFELGDTTQIYPIRITFANENGWKVNTSPMTIYQSAK